MDQNKIHQISESLTDTLLAEFDSITLDPAERAMMAFAYAKILNIVCSHMRLKSVPAFLRATANALELAIQEFGK